jgi:hypothetical protein
VRSALNTGVATLGVAPDCRPIRRWRGESSDLSDTRPNCTLIVSPTTAQRGSIGGLDAWTHRPHCDLIKAKISKLLDRAENPAETLDYAYQRQPEDLQNVKKGIADVVTAKKRLQIQESELKPADPEARRPGKGGDVGRA